MSVVKILIAVLVMGGSTLLSWQMAVAGAGLSDDLNQTASIRAGSEGGSRVVVGGGIHSGK